MSEDRDALDALQDDMAEHQRRYGGEVTAEANRALASTTFERVERELADVSPAPIAPDAVLPAPPPITTRREVKGREYLMHKGPDKPLVRIATPAEAEFMQKAMARCLILQTLVDPGPVGQPSWRDRLLAVLATKGKAAAWHAASEEPEQLAQSRRTLEKDQALLKLLGLETISQLTPAFCRAKAAELEQQYLAELIEVLEASNAIGSVRIGGELVKLGDWKSDPPKRLQV